MGTVVLVPHTCVYRIYIYIYTYINIYIYRDVCISRELESEREREIERARERERERERETETETETEAETETESGRALSPHAQEVSRPRLSEPSGSKCPNMMVLGSSKSQYSIGMHLGFGYLGPLDSGEALQDCCAHLDLHGAQDNDRISQNGQYRQYRVHSLGYFGGPGKSAQAADHGGGGRAHLRPPGLKEGLWFIYHTSRPMGLSSYLSLGLEPHS